MITQYQMVQLNFITMTPGETTSGGVEVSSGNLTIQSNGRIFVGNGGSNKPNVCKCL